MLENMSDTEEMFFILLCIALMVIIFQAVVYKDTVHRYDMLISNITSSLPREVNNSFDENDIAETSTEPDDPDMVCFDCKDGTFIRVHKDDLDEYGCPKSIPKLKFTIEE